MLSLCRQPLTALVCSHAAEPLKHSMRKRVNLEDATRAAADSTRQASLAYKPAQASAGASSSHPSAADSSDEAGCKRKQDEPAQQHVEKRLCIPGFDAGEGDASDRDSSDGDSDAEEVTGDEWTDEDVEGMGEDVKGADNRPPREEVVNEV